MNNPLLLRRRLMMQQQVAPPPEYIQDGLVLWLDGLNKGADNGDWIDLIGGRRYVNNGGVISTEDGFYFNKADNSYLIYNRSLEYALNSYQIECVLMPEMLHDWGLLFTTGGTTDNKSYIGLKISLNTSYQINTVNGYSERIPVFTIGQAINKKSTISANINLGICNKIISGRGSSDATSNFSYSIIGGRWWNNRFYNTGRYKGFVYAIRVYNRFLTTEEMLYNQEIDNIRFNLGL